MNYFQNYIEIPAWLDAISFRFRPKSDEPVQRGLQMAALFEKLSSDERSQIIELISIRNNMKLLALSGFMAEAAINTKNAAFIRGALILHLLENFRKDYRENFRYLALIAFAANELGIKLPHIIDSLLDIASNQARQHLIDFSARNERLNKLSSFGIKGDLVDGIFQFSPL